MRSCQLFPTSPLFCHACPSHSLYLYQMLPALKLGSTSFAMSGELEIRIRLVARPDSPAQPAAFLLFQQFLPEIAGRDAENTRVFAVPPRWIGVKDDICCPSYTASEHQSLSLLAIASPLATSILHFLTTRSLIRCAAHL